MNTKSIDKGYAQYIVGVIISIVWVIIIASRTNSLDINKYNENFADFKYFVDMAENGIIGNTHLLAPFAYRFITPLFARIISQAFAVPIMTGFRIIAYIGAISQLFLVFVLTKYFRSNFWHGMVTMAVVALSLCNVKLLIFNVFWPDHLAYPLMIIATLALFKRNIILCLAASCFGLLVREYLIIPPIILLCILFNEYIKERSKSAVLWMIIVLFSVSLAFLLPRILIPVLEASSYTYPISNKESLTGIIRQPILLKKDLNILLGLIGYLLPIILLATKERFKHAWIQLAGYRPFLLIYSAIVLLLTFFLGSDIMRYVTYLFVPQVIFISILLNNGVDKREIIFMLIAVAIYNRIFLQIPAGNINLYLDFMGAYGTRINIASIKHLFELMVYVLLAIFLRVFLKRHDTVFSRVARAS